MGVNGRMETTMAFTLMHELVGHAVPKLILLNDSKRQEGNAIANDNEVREELKDNGHKNVEARKEDDKHGEYKDH